MNAFKTMVFGCAVTVIGAAIADGPFYLSGTNLTSAVRVTSATNATVTLDGWYSEKTLILTNETASPVVFTIKEKKGSENVIKVNDNTPAIDAYGCDIVFDGKGSGEFISKKKVSKGFHSGGIVICRNLTVDGGETTVKFDQDKPDTACVLLTGNYLQTAGDFKVSMPELSEADSNQFYGVKFDKKNTTFTLEDGNFEANVGGQKSAGVDLKGSCTANLNGGEFLVTVKGRQVRGINGGTINFAGAKVKCEVHESITDLSKVANAKLFNAERGISITAGKISLDLESPDTELICCDDSITISGGKLSLVADNDCINAQTNVVIGGGQIYARSVHGDGIDANRNITVNDGLVLAYALYGEEKGLDVNNAGVSGETPGVLTINGGTVVSLGGPQSHFQGENRFNQPCFTAAQTSSAPYSSKYLKLAGLDALGRPMTTTVHLPAMTENFSILATAPGFTVPQALTLEDVAPSRGDIGFHEVWIERVPGTVLEVY